MFTGIIKTLGHISEISPLNEGLDVWISCDDASILSDIGDSISVNGVCSTIVEIRDNAFKVLYLDETLKKSNFSELKKGDIVNLEPALRLNDLIGGHLISGHVDAVGKIEELKKGDPWGLIRISFDASFAANIVEKGSICMDGISLTVVDVTKTSFSCHLIPHTFDETVLKSKTVSDTVNLEFDLVGKYILRQETLKHE